MTVRELLAGCGASAAERTQLYDAWSERSGGLAELIDCCSEGDLQDLATWMMKHHVQSGYVPTTDESERLFSILPELSYWEARLHLLQVAGQIDAPASMRHRIFADFLKQTRSDNKFVRAWAYGGIYRLSRQFPEFRSEADGLISHARLSEAPSVRARIRNAIKEGEDSRQMQQSPSSSR